MNFSSTSARSRPPFYTIVCLPESFHRHHFVAWNSMCQCFSIVVPHLLNGTSWSSTIITNGKLLPLLPLCNKLQYFLPIIVCHSWTRRPCLLRIIMWCWAVALKLVAFSLVFCNLFLNTCIRWNWRRLQKGSKDVGHRGTIESIWSC